MTGLTRRRFIAISAAAAYGSHPALAISKTSRPTPWRGIALGAEAEIRLDVADRADAAEIIQACWLEIDRLENLFSLYRPESAIARLNRDGRLAAPDADFLALLSIAASVHRATGGAFDPTVQSLWEAYARIHTEFPDDGSGRRKAIAATHEGLAERIGFDAVAIGPDRISFDRPGMALTLNGVAQGYITDRIAELLRARGLHHVLVNIGELRALDGRRDGRDWPVRIAEPGNRKATVRTLRLNNRALATSEPLGTTFLIREADGPPQCGGRSASKRRARRSPMPFPLHSASCRTIRCRRCLRHSPVPGSFMSCDANRQDLWYL
jgi:thiamine biosynthesis lipoprotein